MSLPGCCPNCGNPYQWEYRNGSIVPVCPFCCLTSAASSGTGVVAVQPDSLDALRSENVQLRSENAMLRKMQPVVLEGDAARSLALAVELSETKQALAALRADIEAGRLVRVPCKRGDTVWAVRSYRDFKHPQQGVVSEMYFNPDMKLHVIVKHVARGELGKTVFLTRDEAEQAARAAKEDGNA